LELKLRFSYPGWLFIHEPFRARDVHARRKFDDIHVVHASPFMTEAIAHIGALCGIEEEVRCKSQIAP
jgi:hypothetical protein